MKTKVQKNTGKPQTTPQNVNHFGAGALKDVTDY